MADQTDIEQARAEGFAAGVFFTSLMVTLDAVSANDHVEEWAAFFEGGGVQG